MPNRRKSDRDEELDEIKNWVTEERIKNGIREGITKWTRAVCITAVTVLWGSCVSFGAFLYNHWKPVEIAIKAFFIADNGGHG